MRRDLHVMELNYSLGEQEQGNAQAPPREERGISPRSAAPRDPVKQDELCFAKLEAVSLPISLLLGGNFVV